MASSVCQALLQLRSFSQLEGGLWHAPQTLTHSATSSSLNPKLRVLDPSSCMWARKPGSSKCVWVNIAAVRGVRGREARTGACSASVPQFALAR